MHGVPISREQMAAQAAREQRDRDERLVLEAIERALIRYTPIAMSKDRKFPFRVKYGPIKGRTLTIELFDRKMVIESMFGPTITWDNVAYETLKSDWLLARVMSHHLNTIDPIVLHRLIETEEHTVEFDMVSDGKPRRTFVVGISSVFGFLLYVTVKWRVMDGPFTTRQIEAIR